MTAENLLSLNVSHDEINPNDLISWVVSPSAGGISTFLGTTREAEGDLIVEHLEYEAYIPLCLSYFRKLCEETFQKYDVTKICIHHRIGIVKVGEISIMIAVSGPHRKDPIAAVEYIINEVKANAAVWKKSIYSNAEPEYKVNSECSWGRLNTR
jgi:molybdopterin synthase catalytic subunit